MKFIAAVTLSVTLLLTTFSAAAQSQFSGWYAKIAMFRLNDRFSIHFDGQARSTDKLEHLQTLILRPGLNMHFNKNMFATVGYGYILNRREIGGISGYGPEHRIWEQLTISHPLFNTTLSHRLRLEQRFISRSEVENNSLKNNGNDFANRFRYFFRSLLPLTGKLKANTPFIALQNEAFVNLGDKSAVNGEFFDQNRAYVALGYRFSAAFDLEVGYLNQYINGREKDFTNNHVLQVASYLRL